MSRGILEAAFGVFASYGYRRTRMADIVQAAGLSRSAFYLHFRNKSDIFRLLTKRHFDASIADHCQVTRNKNGCNIMLSGQIADQVQDRRL